MRKYVDRVYMYMKTGVEYAHSREKRAFDVAVARALVLPAHMGLHALRATELFKHDDYIFTQERVGRYGSLFEIQKIRTLQHDSVAPLNSLADMMRRTGLDETMQYRNILDGTMSAVGHRPIVSYELEVLLETVDTQLTKEWGEYVAPTRPGQVSTFALESHLGFEDLVDQGEERLSRDVEDVLRGSLVYDAALVLRTIHKALSNKMQHGRISHEPHVL